jgi:hypothetical protein
VSELSEAAARLRGKARSSAYERGRSHSSTTISSVLFWDTVAERPLELARVYLSGIKDLPRDSPPSATSDFVQLASCPSAHVRILAQAPTEMVHLTMKDRVKLECHTSFLLAIVRFLLALHGIVTLSDPIAVAEEMLARKESDVPIVSSSWDDLLEGVATPDAWQRRRAALREHYLELIHDKHKPDRPPRALVVHETRVIDRLYKRLLVSYAVEADERAHAYIGIPLKISGKAPGVVALHGTYREGAKQTAGLVDDPDKAYLDHLCRRGYVVIAPEHFVSGHRIPAEGPYDTTEFYERHPEWTAVGKFTYEHSIAIDVLESLPEVDAQRIGAMGHSLGGQGSMFLAAYDNRVRAAAGNCSASFFRHNPEVEHWARDHWYVYLKHLRPQLMRGELPPIDFHEIMSLIAPRAYLDVSALNDGSRPVQRQRVLMLMKVADAYELMGKSENFAFFVHGRGHSAPHDSRALIYGFLDAHLKPPKATKTKRVSQ